MSRLSQTAYYFSFVKAAVALLSFVSLFVHLNLTGIFAAGALGFTLHEGVCNLPDHEQHGAG
jgi:hypothetical protein